MEKINKQTEVILKLLVSKRAGYCVYYILGTVKVFRERTKCDENAFLNSEMPIESYILWRARAKCPSGKSRRLLLAFRNLAW